jgi:predicted porin
MLNFKLARPMLVALAACAASVAFNGTVFADDAADAKALKQQMQMMQQQMQALQKQIDAMAARQQAAAAQAAAPPAVVVTKESKEPAEPKFDKLVKGFYGRLDVSLDYTTKGMDGFVAYPFNYVDPTNPNSGYVRGSAKGGGAGPVGNVGWQAALSSNKSVLGYRGVHKITDTDVDFIYQIEVQPQITNAPGTSGGYTSQSNVTKGGIGYGDSFVGIANHNWGSFKFGTTYTPYKKSTDRMNPFSGMLGDYGVVMGNTGGDNRVEFGTRMDHSMWYESPKFGGVFSFDALFSPSQNRTPDSLAPSSGSPDCNGGNEAGSGNLPIACDDGGYANAYSIDLKFETGPVYLTAAYEVHKQVNRNSDGVGANNPYYGYLMGQGDPVTGIGQSPLLNWAAYNAFAAEYPQAAPFGTPEYQGDIADETAFKVGAQYKFDFGLTVSGIYEDMKRKLPAEFQFQNERQRNGYWLALSQDFSVKDNVSVGWAHAGKTPGDPGGQHNYDPTKPDNHADMYTIAWKHHFDKSFYWYIDAAETVNSANAHYDLGAGGRGVTTDCHDGTTQPFIDYSSAGPTTWGGCRPKGVSTGMNYQF